MDEALNARVRLGATVIDPELIVKVRTSTPVPEEEWARAGLTVLGNDGEDAVVLFSNDLELREFQARLDAYGTGTPLGRQNPQYATLIGSIEEFRSLEPRDRIGSSLRSEGFETPESFTDERDFFLDAELWDVGTQQERFYQVDVLSRRIAELGGEISDRYIGHSFTALRVVGSGRVVRWILTLPVLRLIDFPPAVDAEIGRILEMGIDDLGVVEPPDEGAPLVGVLDTGVNSAHPLLVNVVADRVAVPQSLGVSDDHGHGTRVSGIAAYGDIRSCIEDGEFQAAARLLSGRILNDQGQFLERRLVHTQIDQIVRLLHQLGCRIFNLSIADRKSRFDGGRVGTWAAMLDELARELDILFVVAAGNYEHQAINGDSEDHLLGYPRYILSPECRLLEPATAANALTVGAVAEVATVPIRVTGDVGLRPIAGAGEPSPFTRCGPGVAGAVKPDLCDSGGNLLFDGITQGLVRREECEVITTYPRYLERLFATDRGTSMAAPVVTHKAALVLQAFPNASANLIRALLVNSARQPEPAKERLRHFGAEAIWRACGFGIADPIASTISDTNRVVLFDDSEIRMDHFFIYEIPIPAEFSATRGPRHIRVTLAYDPPTRHTRAQYLGVEMSFRMVRGRTLEEVVEHYRRRDREQEGPVPEQPARHDCKFERGPATRECGTVQSAVFSIRQNPRPEYGETYYLVVRCERRWFADDLATQRFAVVVELEHSADIRLYERVRERVRVRVHA
ncbi:MAG TPA: S8 family peptidase [Terracidiphilus sp.]|nr:S8 family peptidase [Terracidiphilus sp.]